MRMLKGSGLVPSMNSSTSRNPLVASRPATGPLRWMMALVPMVVPWTMRLHWEMKASSEQPSSSHASAIPPRMPCSGSSRSLSALKTSMAPSSSSATVMSVKVPPMSMPTL